MDRLEVVKKSLANLLVSLPQLFGFFHNPVSVLSRPLFLWPLHHHVLAMVVVCLSAVGLFYLVVQQQRLATEPLEQALEATKRSTPANVEQTPLSLAAPVERLNPDQWPPRQPTLDDLIRDASEAAKSQDINIRSVSVSHQLATASAWGRVTLEVSTTGSYAATKTWQAELMQRFPTLVVQRLLIQGGVGQSPGGLDSQWTWVLHVRD